MSRPSSLPAKAGSSPIVLRVPIFSTLANAAFALRRQVFVHEQGVPPELENDADDLSAIHFASLADGEVVGALRLLRKPEHIKIGRVAVHPAWRRRGIASAMMRAAMEAARLEGHERFHLSAQADKLGVYEKLGFVAFGPEFEEAGIRHRSMRTYEP